MQMEGQMSDLPSAAKAVKRYDDGMRFSYKADHFHLLVSEIKLGREVTVTGGGESYTINPVPNGVKVHFTSAMFVEIRSKRGRAPRGMKKGDIFCMRHPVTGRVVIFKIFSGVGEEGRRDGIWRYVKVRVPAPTSAVGKEG